MTKEIKTENFALESDKRFPPPVRWLAEQFRRNAVKYQTEQQELVARHFEKDDTINFQSIIREPNATGGDGLKEKLQDSPGKPKVILLLNGIINPQDIVQVSTFVEHWGMKLLRLQQNLHSKVSNVLDNTEMGDSIPHYIVKTSRTMQKEIFDGLACDVIVVRNASKQDLLDVVKYGGGNTVLVVGGHGSLGTLSMTDGEINNASIPTPNKPLKAFVQHTCAAPDDLEQKMGERWAETVYGWGRKTSPVDFIDNPLVLRNH